MKYIQYNICNLEGKSNCVVRTFCKLLNENYDNIYNELCNIKEELKCESYNDVLVFETFMKRNNINAISYGRDMLVKDLELSLGEYIVFCYDKKDYYHMIPIIDNVIYDKNDKCLDLYVINVYERT